MNAPRIAKKRVIAIDDDPVTLKLIEVVLKSEGCVDYHLLTKAEECIECLAESCPDLVITDLAMPGFDGMQVIEWVRDWTPPGEVVPVLVLTASNSQDKRRDALTAGATDFVLKPFDPTEFRARLRNLLRIRELHLATLEYTRSLEATVAERTRELECALAELETNQRMLLQQERLRAFAEMAGGVVHDFNNSLMTIIGYSGILAGEESILEDHAEVRRLAQIIHSSGNDASRVLEWLRGLYRGQLDQNELAPVGLNAVLRETAEISEPRRRHQVTAGGPHTVKRQERTPGDGSAIRAHLPRPTQEPVLTAVTRPDLPAACSVLIVDKEHQTRAALRAMLAPDGHTVIGVRTGSEALELLEKMRFDVILADLAMSGMTGAELATHAQRLNPRQRTILITGFPVVAGDSLPGVDAIVQKPATVGALREALSSVTPRTVLAA